MGRRYEEIKEKEKEKKEEITRRERNKFSGQNSLSLYSCV
jgi:hypothetical protein